MNANDTNELKKPIFLFLALLLPILIFLFLKFFGKNEFAVAPLYANVYPISVQGCSPITELPYLVPDSVMSEFGGADSLSVVFFGDLRNESANQFSRVKDETSKDRVGVMAMPLTPRAAFWKRCVFFLDENKDIVLIDKLGNIRGNYKSTDRDEVDRLLTEITIILKKY